MAFNNFPYTDAHELNLDWVIRTVKEYVQETAKLESDVAAISAKVDNFISTLDIPAEVQTQINALISSGAFEDMIAQAIEDNYGNDNIYARLHGKTIIAMGDSMFTGSLGSSGNTWLEMLATKYGATVYNYGYSGSKISMGGTAPSASDMAYRIDEILSDHATCDYFVVCGGANDWNQDVPIGGIDSIYNYTFIGAIKNIIVKIQRKYGKACCILFMTLYHRYDTYNGNHHSEIDYANAMKNACAYFSIPCYDNYSNAGISLATTIYENPQNKWADAGLVAGQSANHHFSVAAYEYLLPKYAAFLSNGYAQVANKMNPELREIADTTNTYTLQLARTFESDGSWSEYGRIVLANLAFSNQFVEGDEWYYSDTIQFNLPTEVQSQDNWGWNITVAASQGVVIASQPTFTQGTLQLRFLRYKSNTAINLLVTLYKRCLPESMNLT